MTAGVIEIWNEKIRSVLEYCVIDLRYFMVIGWRHGVIIGVAHILACIWFARPGMPESDSGYRCACFTGSVDAVEEIRQTSGMCPIFVWNMNSDQLCVHGSLSHKNKQGPLLRNYAKRALRYEGVIDMTFPGAEWETRPPGDLGV